MVATRVFNLYKKGICIHLLPTTTQHLLFLISSLAIHSGMKCNLKAFHLSFCDAGKLSYNVYVCVTQPLVFILL